MDLSELLEGVIGKEPERNPVALISYGSNIEEVGLLSAGDGASGVAVKVTGADSILTPDYAKGRLHSAGKGALMASTLPRVKVVRDPGGPFTRAELGDDGAASLQLPGDVDARCATFARMPDPGVYWIGADNTVSWMTGGKGRRSPLPGNAGWDGIAWVPNGGAEWDGGPVLVMWASTNGLLLIGTHAHFFTQG